MKPLLLLVLVACTGSDPQFERKHRTTPGGTPTGTPVGLYTGQDSGSTTETTAWSTTFDCTARPTGPFAMTSYPIATEEDFSFDVDGHLVYQQFQSILGADQAGVSGILATGAPGDPSGLDVVSTTELLIAGPDTGSLRLMDLTNGTGITLLSNLSQPNSVLGGNDGLYYVTELNQGRARWVDTDNDTSGPAASGLGSANGIALSPDEQTLYIAGTDTITAVHRDAAGVWDASTAWNFFVDPGNTFFTLDVDFCGWLYTVGYSTGNVIRISPDGSTVEPIAQLGNQGWGNWGGMNFGNDQGGWDRESVFFTNRSVVVGVEIGIPGSRGPNILPP